MTGTYEKGCIICALSWFLKWGNINGIFLYRYSCRHSNKAATTCTLQFQNLNAILTVVQIVMLTFGVIITVQDILKIHGDSTLVLYSGVFVIHYVVSISCLVCSLIFQCEPSYFEQLLDVTRTSRKEFQVECIFSKKSEKTVRVTLIFITCFCVLLTLMPFLDCHSGPFTIYNFLAALLISKETLRVTGLTIIPCVYSYIFRDMNDQIADRLNRLRSSRFQKTDVSAPDAMNILELNYRTIKPFMDEDRDMFNLSEPRTLADDILKYHRLYIKLVSHIRYFNQTNDLIMAITFLLVLVIVSINFYLFVICIIEDKDPYFLFMAILNGVSMIVLPIYFIVCCERLIAKILDLQAFLYNYPLTSLQKDEIAAIEIFIMSIHNNPPVMSASNVVKCRSSVLFSIYGAMLTYLIMALQFRLAKD